VFESRELRRIFGPKRNEVGRTIKEIGWANKNCTDLAQDR
jgi:hypothetical protein